MPFPSTIILDNPKVALQQVSSGASGTKPTNSSYILGIVSAIYETSDRTNVGQVVLFNPQKAIEVIHENESYYLVDEPELFFRDGAPL
jgi:hypothetical protein